MAATLLRVGDVRAQCDRAPAGCDDLLNQGRSGISARDIVHAHRRALLSQSTRRGTPDTASRPGHHRHLITPCHCATMLRAVNAWQSNCRRRNHQ
jgi:hypothetical protein